MNTNTVNGTTLQLPAGITLSAPVAEQTLQAGGFVPAKGPRPTLYIAIFFTWLACLLWFGPRLLQLLSIPHNWQGYTAIGLFIIFIGFAWLYGLYNIFIMVFALYCRRFRKNAAPVTAVTALPPVAILYTTCNDFVENSAASCVNQDYPDYTVYILDDSTEASFQERVDAFARQYKGVKVIRRSHREGFKAGNLNHGLATAAINEPYFAIADADEILPPDFLRKLVPIMEQDPSCGFVQANHRANPNDASPLAKSAGIGIDIHWKYYQPLRNDYGFVMFLGHGALLRRSCWVQSGGFPDIVSEDLGFAIRIREMGYRGRFAEEVICYESFPETVRAFRIRHMKWTRGTSEFLGKEFRRLVKAKNITLQEKLDILFPTLNLPLTLVYFLFMINANIILPLLFGKISQVTLVMGGNDFVVPVLTWQQGFEVIYSWDFFLITLLTFVSPILCFIVALAARPVRLFRFLSHSTALYAALTPLSSIGVLAYMVTRKAIFLVTGDTKQTVVKNEMPGAGLWRSVQQQVGLLLRKSHPDQAIVQWFEMLTGVVFGTLCVLTFQLSCLGLCLSFMLLPLLHVYKWEHPVLRVLVHVPFIIILLGLALMTMSAFGMQTVFFGYGFHF